MLQYANRDISFSGMAIIRIPPLRILSGSTWGGRFRALSHLDVQPCSPLIRRFCHFPLPVVIAHTSSVSTTVCLCKAGYLGRGIGALLSCVNMLPHLAICDREPAIAICDSQPPAQEDQVNIASVPEPHSAAYFSPLEIPNLLFPSLFLYWLGATRSFVWYRCVHTTIFNAFPHSSYSPTLRRWGTSFRFRDTQHVAPTRLSTATTSVVRRSPTGSETLSPDTVLNSQADASQMNTTSGVSSSAPLPLVVLVNLEAFSL